MDSVGRPLTANDIKDLSNIESNTNGSKTGGENCSRIFNINYVTGEGAFTEELSS